MALWQAYFFQDQLNELGLTSEIKVITTRGDKIQHLSFDKIEGKGFFTKEIESALLNSEIDVAIHSHKDLETKQPAGLTIGGVSYRENPAEYLIIRKECVDHALPLGFKSGSIIGTSSARRKSQVLDMRPDIKLKDIRGNVPTRINKLRSGEFDAILLAAAGVIRLKLNLDDLEVRELDPRLFIPAAAQGVLAYQCRENDRDVLGVLKKLHHSDVAECINIERTILSEFGGGCHIPIGVFATKTQGAFHVRASYGKEWESYGTRVRIKAESPEMALAKFESLKVSSKPCKSLITKSLDQSSLLKRACAAHKIKLLEIPMIEIKHLPFDMPSSFDWVFFSSKNGVEAFFSNVDSQQLESVKYAAYGESTARSLSKYVTEISFIGQLGQPKEVASEFASLLSGEKVLFPTSSISLRSMQKALLPELVIDLTVYESVPKPQIVENDIDRVIFTSPSNVSSFFAQNKLDPTQTRIISIGESTAKAVTSLGYVSETADFAHEAELFALVCS